MTRAATPQGDGSQSFPARPLILDPVAAYRLRMQPTNLITRADVRAAVALLPRQQRDGLGMPYGFRHTNQSSRLFERERWYLEVSPGTVRLRSRLMAPKVSLSDNEQMDEGRAGKPITEFSSESRSRMTSVLPSLDYAPMFASNGVAAMVTLTLPGEGWEQLVPDLPTFKKMLWHFQKEYARAWGSRPVAVWKMEFQRRGAPHVHLFMVPPTGTARGRGVARDFPNWLSITWAKIVGAPLGSVARKNHELAGTGIDYREGARFSDPRRIAVYFSKHGQFADKEYQNEMPEHWRRAIVEGRSGGARFWGYWQLEKAVETVELRVGPPPRRLEDEPVMHRHATPRRGETGEYTEVTSIMSDCPETPVYPDDRDVVVVRRHLRKLARARSYVKPTSVERWSVDVETGVVKVRRRKVNRRFQYFNGQRAGFLVVNDGPSTARDIARLLGTPTRRSDYELVS